MLYLASDHRGFNLKEEIKEYLTERGISFEDLGNLVLDLNDDYPDFAKEVAEKISEDPEKNRGILICGSGIGVDVVANKFKGVRSGLCTTPEIVKMGRKDDNINVLSLAADITDANKAKEIVKAFLETKFAEEEKYRRRIEKISQLE